MSHARNLIIIRAGATNKKGDVTRWAKVTLRKLAKIIHESIALGRAFIVSGPDKAGTTSLRILRDELEKLNNPDKRPEYEIPTEESVLLGKEYDIRDDDEPEEIKHVNRHLLARLILELIRKRHEDGHLDTIIIITHLHQSVIVQDAYSHSVLGDDSRHSYGGVLAGGGILMNKLSATAMTTPLTSELRYQNLKGK